jgi:hypothetical protein
MRWGLPSGSLRSSMHCDGGINEGYTAGAVAAGAQYLHVCVSPFARASERFLKASAMTARVDDRFGYGRSWLEGRLEASGIVRMVADEISSVDDPPKTRKLRLRFLQSGRVRSGLRGYRRRDAAYMCGLCLHIARVRMK